MRREGERTYVSPPLCKPKKFFKKAKKMLDIPGRLCYYNIRKRKKGANPMNFRDYFEAHEAEWEAEQEYLREQSEED